MKKLGLYFFLFLTLNTFSQSNTDDLRLYDRFLPVSKDNIFKTKDYYNWGTSIIKAKDGKYHLFYSRWKKEHHFSGWLLFSEIAHAVSKSPAGPWKYKETVLKGRGKGYWDAITAHNPKIKYFNGKYYLYYISTNFGDKAYSEKDLLKTAEEGFKNRNWMPLRNRQRVGVAVSNSLNGPWKRMDKPIIEPSGPITKLTVNPAVAQSKDGKFFMIVKGDKSYENYYIRNQAVAVSDTPTGPFHILEKPVIDYMDTEDISMWFDQKRDRFYAVFHTNKGAGFIGMVTSKDGINWKKSNEFVLMPKQFLLNDGSLFKPNRLERPFIFYENGKVKVLSLAVKNGDESYSVFIPIKEEKYPLPNKRQLAWQEAELGVLISYDLHVFDGKKYEQRKNRINPVDNYQIFNPQHLNTDQWIKAVKDAGAKFAILTATHETGFALYQSDVNPYCMKALKYKDGKGDLVRDFVDSCKKYGVKPGIYLGIRWNSFLGVHNFKVQGEGEFKENRQRWYNKMVEGMVKEICTNYGELFEIWFDGGADHPDNGAPDVLPIVRQYQPNCLFYHNGQLAEARWGGSETGTVGYPCWATFPYKATGAGETAQKDIYKNNYQMLKQGDPNGKYWMPAMADAPLRGYNGRHEWFWEPGDEKHIFPVKNLMEMYYKSVGRNATLIIGLTPDPDGLLPEPDVKRLKEWGNEIKKRFSTPLASSSGEGEKIILKLKKPKLVDHIIIREDIRHGERIKKYRIDGFIDGKWTLLVQGESIGNKRIERFTPKKVSRIRLISHTLYGKPLIKELSVFYTGASFQ